MQTIIATAWVHLRQRRMLVVRPAKSDVFYQPGGKPEPGETYAESAAREVREELGLTIDPASLRRFTEIVAPTHDRAPGAQVRLICFMGGDPDSEPKAAAEIAELAWVGSGDAGRCAPASQVLLGELVTAGLID